MSLRTKKVSFSDRGKTLPVDVPGMELQAAQTRSVLHRPEMQIGKRYGLSELACMERTRKAGALTPLNSPPRHRCLPTNTMTQEVPSSPTGRWGFNWVSGDDPGLLAHWQDPPKSFSGVIFTVVQKRPSISLLVYT